MDFHATPQQAGMRLDAFLNSVIPGFSRARIQKAIRAGGCIMDGMPVLNPAAHVKAGQSISITLEETPPAIQPTAGDMPVIWADEHLAIIDKPAQLTVHPCPSCAGETLVHRLLARFPQLRSLGGLRPGIVHRLDKDTSGLLAVALTETDRLELAGMFEAREVKKKYLALVLGCPPEKGDCLESVGRHPTQKTRMAIVAEKNGGRPAATSWRRLWHSPQDNLALLEVSIQTGRTHQIRVHLSSLGWPIIGDSVYGSAYSASLAPRQMLHAWQLGLPHPATRQWLEFTASPPDDFMATILANFHPYRRIVVTGNQGCGKSSFCSALKELGMPVISADGIVAQLYARGGEAAQWIGARLGEKALNADGSVDKSSLFQILQESPHLRGELEKVVHGFARIEIESFWNEQKAAGEDAAVAEIPLFFESGFQDQIKDAFVVGISCSQATRWERIKKNRNWSEEKIRTLESWQWPEAKKMALCDLVIPNNIDKGELAIEAKMFYDQLTLDRKKLLARLERKLVSIWTVQSIDL